MKKTLKTGWKLPFLLLHPMKECQLHHGTIPSFLSHDTGKMSESRSHIVRCEEDLTALQIPMAFLYDTPSFFGGGTSVVSDMRALVDIAPETIHLITCGLNHDGIKLKNLDVILKQCEKRQRSGSNSSGTKREDA